MPKYKNTESDEISNVYDAVKNQLDFETGEDTPIEEVQATVDEYLTGKIDTAALLATIANELDWVDSEQDLIDTAIALVPDANTAQLKNIMIGILEHDRRILQENKRMMKAWRWWIKNGIYE